MKKIHKKIFSLATTVLVAAFLFFSSSPVLAASIYFSPNTASYKVGQTFTVGVYVSSSDQAMNTASATVNFPANLLEATAISKSGTIISLWTQEPSISSGSAHFEGLVLNPGYTGSSGKIVSITFKVKAEGKATVTLAGASVLANDGLGTSILSGVGSATYTLGAGTATPPPAEDKNPEPTPTPTETPVDSGTPRAPAISSATHPNPSVWYKEKNAQVSWSLSSGVTAVTYLLTESPTSNPGTNSTVAYRSASFNDLADGVHYVHVRAKNASGWGAVAHYALQIDATAPAIPTIRFPHGNEVNESRPVMEIASADAGSGIAYYEVRINDSDPIRVTAESLAKDGFTLPEQTPGTKTIKVTAYDQAGNSAESTAQVTIQLPAAPKFDTAPKKINLGENLRLTGTSAAHSKVTIYVQDSSGVVRQESATMEESGNFSLVWSAPLAKGLYTYWAVATDDRELQSAPTEHYSLEVVDNILLRFGTTGLIYGAIAILALLLLFILILLMRYLWHHYQKVHHRLRRDPHISGPTIHKTIERLEEHLGEYVEVLERAKYKRSLSAEERHLLDMLKKDKGSVEKLYSRKLRDLE